MNNYFYTELIELLLMDFMQRRTLFLAYITGGLLCHSLVFGKSYDRQISLFVISRSANEQIPYRRCRFLLKALLIACPAEKGKFRALSRLAAPSLPSRNKKPSERLYFRPMPLSDVRAPLSAMQRIANSDFSGPRVRESWETKSKVNHWLTILKRKQIFVNSSNLNSRLIWRLGICLTLPYTSLRIFTLQLGRKPNRARSF